MLFTLYLLLAVIGFTALFLGLKYGSFGSGNVVVQQDEHGASSAGYVTKLFLTAMFLILAAIMFFVLGYASYDIEMQHCDSIISNTMIQADNVTTVYTYDTVCSYTQYIDETMGEFFLVMGVAALVLLVIYSFKDFAGMVS